MIAFYPLLIFISFIFHYLFKNYTRDKLVPWWISAAVRGVFNQPEEGYSSSRLCKPTPLFDSNKSSPIHHLKKKVFSAHSLCFSWEASPMWSNQTSNDHACGGATLAHVTVEQHGRQRSWGILVEQLGYVLNGSDELVKILLLWSVCGSYRDPRIPARCQKAC